MCRSLPRTRCSRPQGLKTANKTQKLPNVVCEQKGGEGESGAAATEDPDLEIDMEVSGPGLNPDTASTSEGGGKLTKKAFSLF